MLPALVRRPVSVGSALIATAAAVVALPIWLPIAVAVDVISAPTRPVRLRCSRIGLFLIGLGINELRTVGEVAVAWVRSGFGRTVFTPACQRRMQRILLVYARGLVGTARILGVRIEAPTLEVVLDPSGPLLFFGHHTSLLDSALPAFLFGNAGRNLRYVLKDSLQNAPAFDLGGHCLPVHFVNRSGTRTDAARKAIRTLTAEMGEADVSVLFPEGTFWNPARQQAAIERLRVDAPHLVERAQAWRHTLPPRPAGALAMLEGAPSADVIVCAHAGLESFASLRSIVRNVPLAQPVHVVMWRVKRDEVPSDPSEQYEWLFDQFEKIDRTISNLLS